MSAGALPSSESTRHPAIAFRRSVTYPGCEWLCYRLYDGAQGNRRIALDVIPVSLQATVQQLLERVVLSCFSTLGRNQPRQFRVYPPDSAKAQLSEVECAALLTDTVAPVARQSAPRQRRAADGRHRSCSAHSRYASTAGCVSTAPLLDHSFSALFPSLCCLLRDRLCRATGVRRLGGRARQASDGHAGSDAASFCGRCMRMTTTLTLPSEDDGFSGIDTSMYVCSLSFLRPAQCTYSSFSRSTNCSNDTLGLPVCCSLACCSSGCFCHRCHIAISEC